MDAPDATKARLSTVVLSDGKLMMSAGFIRGAWRRVARYMAHDDPLVEACNLIAFIVASNQPFYPLYVFWAVSDHIWPTFFTFLSTPLFLVVPAVARRYPNTGRTMLPLVGMANTALSAKLFGQASGVEIFLIPCALISATFFRTSERAFAFGLIGLAAAMYVGLNGAYGEPLHIYSPQEYSAFVRLNALSASGLCIFVGLLASRQLSDTGMEQ